MFRSWRNLGSRQGSREHTPIGIAAPSPMRPPPTGPLDGVTGSTIRRDRLDPTRHQWAGALYPKRVMSGVPYEVSIAILNHIGDSRLVLLNNCGPLAALRESRPNEPRRSSHPSRPIDQVYPQGGQPGWPPAGDWALPGQLADAGADFGAAPRPFRRSPALRRTPTELSAAYATSDRPQAGCGERCPNRERPSLPRRRSAFCAFETHREESHECRRTYALPSPPRDYRGGNSDVRWQGLPPWVARSPQGYGTQSLAPVPIPGGSSALER